MKDLGIVPGIGLQQVLQRNRYLIPRLRPVLPLARLVQIHSSPEAQICRLTVVVLRELRHRQVPLVWRQLAGAVDGLPRRQGQGRSQGHPENAAGPERLCKVGHAVVPRLRFSVPAAKPGPHHLHQGPDGDNEAAALPHHQNISAEPLTIGEGLPVRAGQPHPQQGLARRGAEDSQGQRLQKRQQDCRGEAGAQAAYHAWIDPGQTHSRDQRQDHQKLIKHPGEEPPGGAAHRGQPVALGQCRGQGALPQRGARLFRQGWGVQVRQIPPRVQGCVGGPRPPQVAADTLHPVQRRPLAAQLRQAPVQHGGQVRLSRPQGPELLDGHPQPPQELDLLQRPQVLLAVVPVAVAPPDGGEQPLRLVVADVGPRHAGPGLHLLAGH